MKKNHKPTCQIVRRCARDAASHSTNDQTRLPHKSLIIAMVAFVLGTTANSQDAVPGYPDSLSLLETRLRIETAETKIQNAADRAKRLRGLKKRGNASTVEVKKAELTLAKIQGELRNFETLGEFLETQTNRSDQDVDTGSFVELPGIACRIGAIGFGQLRIENSDQLTLTTAALFDAERAESADAFQFGMLKSFRDWKSAELKKTAFSPDFEKRSAEAAAKILDSYAAASSIRLSIENPTDDRGILATRNSWAATADENELTATLAICQFGETSLAEESVALAALAMKEEKLARLRSLISKGIVSPLEIKKAETACRLARANVTAAAENRAVWAAKAEIVKSVLSRETDAAPAATPRTIDAAIAQFETTFADADLQDHPKLARLAFAKLVDQAVTISEREQAERRFDYFSWYLAQLEAIPSTAATEIRSAKLRLELSRANHELAESHVTQHALELNQLAAIGQRTDAAQLAITPSLIEAIENLVAIENRRTSERDALAAIASQQEWVNERLEEIHAADPANLELVRARQIDRKNKARLAQQNRADALNIHRLRIAKSVRETLGSGEIDAMAQFAPRVRHAFFDYETALAAEDPAAVKIAEIDQQMTQNREDRIAGLLQRGNATQLELVYARIAAGWAMAHAQRVDEKQRRAHYAANQLASVWSDAAENDTQLTIVTP